MGKSDFEQSSTIAQLWDKIELFTSIFKNWHFLETLQLSVQSEIPHFIKCYSFFGNRQKSPALSSKRCYRVSCFLFVPTWSGLKFPWVHLHKLNYLMVSLIPPRPLLALVLLQHLQYGSCVLRVMRLGAICKNINFSVVYFFPRKGRFFGFTTWSSDFYCPPWRQYMIKLGVT